MSVFVKWSCDWCGRVIQQNSIDKAPTGWIKLIRRGSHHQTWGDLCVSCCTGNPKYPVTKHDGVWVEQIQVPVKQHKQETRSVSKSATLKAVLARASLITVMLLSIAWSGAVTVPALTTNTVKVPWSAANGQMFYRLMPVPQLPPPTVTNEASAASRELLPPTSTNWPSTNLMRMALTPSHMTLTNSALIVPVDQIATFVTVTNWTDLPPAGVTPLTTTLADTTQGLEYGIIVTNKVVQVLEDGIVRPMIVSSTTNTTDVLTRLYQFKRVHDPASVKHHRRHPINVR